MILICYDGSPDARAAIEHTGELLKGEPATVLTVWQPITEVIARSTALGLSQGVLDVQEIDEASRKSAEQRTEEGAELAREAGLSAKRRTCSQRTTIAEAILSEAGAVGASAIVVGSAVWPG